MSTARLIEREIERHTEPLRQRIAKLETALRDVAKVDYCPHAFFASSCPQCIARHALGE